MRVTAPAAGKFDRNDAPAAGRYLCVTATPRERHQACHGTRQAERTRWAQEAMIGALQGGHAARRTTAILDERGLVGRAARSANLHERHETRAIGRGAAPIAYGRCCVTKIGATNAL